MDIQVVPHDPQTEYRWRFPDESAQVGKAYHSDLERLALTGGRDGLAWNAIPGGSDPPSLASWSWDPSNTLSWGQGNWSIASFGSGPDAMRITLRRGIAFIGGTVFSVEGSDILLPVDGEDVPSTNAAAQDRWDVLYGRVTTDPTSVNYGKQQFEILQGVPGEGIPAHAGQPVDGKRLAFHALKVAANSGVYSAGFDLRRWLWHPALSAVQRSYLGGDTGQAVAPGLNASVLNTQMAASELILPVGCGWEGSITYNLRAQMVGYPADVLVISEGRGIAGTVIPGTQVLAPVSNSHTMVGANDVVTESTWQSLALTLPVAPLSSYHLDSGVSPASRTWHRLRFGAFFTIGVGAGTTLRFQALYANLRPVM
jgi:hypothetical protein